MSLRGDITADFFPVKKKVRFLYVWEMFFCNRKRDSVLRFLAGLLLPAWHFAPLVWRFSLFAGFSFLSASLFLSSSRIEQRLMAKRGSPWPCINVVLSARRRFVEVGPPACSPGRLKHSAARPAWALGDEMPTTTDRRRSRVKSRPKAAQTLTPLVMTEPCNLHGRPPPRMKNNPGRRDPSPYGRAMRTPSRLALLQPSNRAEKICRAFVRKRAYRGENSRRFANGSYTDGISADSFGLSHVAAHS